MTNASRGLPQCICVFPTFRIEPRVTRWRGWMSSSNTRAMKAAATATGIRRCTRAPARRRIPAGLHRPKVPASHLQCGQHKITIQRSAPTCRLAPDHDWVRLRPGPKRIDELADLIEWIANAKPEDAPAITAEIDRLFKNVGWEAAATDLKNMLAVLTRPGITREDRQQYLDRLDLYTRVDPADALEAPKHARRTLKLLPIFEGRAI